MDWNDVRFFLALARTGSVRAAGQTLGVSHSTVARRVEALEERLATRLFDRNRDGYLLSEAGRQMLPGAERVEREMAAIERGLLGKDERLAGPVHLTCCDGFVSDMMMRRLTEFCVRCPEIELNMTTDSRPYDLAKREADLAVRILAREQSPPEYLIGRKLVPLCIANYVAVEHADRLDPSRADGARWLGFEERKYLQDRIARSGYPAPPLWGSFSSLELLVQATRAGLGICVLPCYVADQDPTLMRLPEADLEHVADLWLLCHPDLRDNARLQATRELVRDAIEANRDLFAGERPQAPGDA